MRARMDARMIYCFSTCKDSIRTIPMLQHDKDRAEDLDTESEDHAADEWRYACMSRPYVRQKQVIKPPRWHYEAGEHIVGNVPIRQLIEDQMRERD